MEQCFLHQSSCQLQLFSLQVTRAFGERYKFNAAVRELMVLYNVLKDRQNETQNSEEFHHALVVLCQLLAPMAPHISSELWEGECGAHVHQLETVTATLHQTIQLASPLNKNISCFFLSKKREHPYVMMCLQ